ncbi:MAG TPA: ABC transporter substrate-binding protein [Xanthobacteraceae bacterium]|nr:ABC transporter substrate-binding protein [Xanthobacteraceae bacterium]
MGRLDRRSVLRGSAAVAAAGTLARPFIANAAAKTANVWWTQGFIAEEDAAFKNVVAEYEKASGNVIDASIIPFGPMMQKIVSALTSGETADLMQNFNAAVTIVPQNAWNDKLVDLTDVMETQTSNFHPSALLSARYYNNVTKKRSFYLVPDRAAVLPFHIWNSLVEKAGFKMSDAPKTWDAFWDFFKPMQKELRGKGMRGLYALGLQPTTTGPADGNNLFHHFLIAYGGNGIVTPDGTPHLDDPRVKEAVIKALTYITAAYKDGYVPPGALSWNDADDNNAFHAKQIIMNLDGTISIELALYHKKDQYDDIVTMGLPLDNAGRPVASQLLVGGAFIPKGAKNVDVAKDFLKYAIQPKVANEYLKSGLGRWLPPRSDLAQIDPFWLDPKDPHRAAYVRQGLLGPTVPNYPAFNPGYAEANAQQIWGTAEADVIREDMTPQAAAEKALNRIGAILAKYPIAQS